VAKKKTSQGDQKGQQATVTEVGNRMVLVKRPDIHQGKGRNSRLRLSPSGREGGKLSERARHGRKEKGNKAGKDGDKVDW